MKSIDFGAIVTLVVALVSVSAAVIAKLVRASDSIKTLLLSISKNGLVTQKQIDKAVEDILSGGRPPSCFVDVIGDIVARLVKTLPDYLATPIADRVRLVAFLFSKEDASKVRLCLSTLPENISRMSWAVRLVVEGVLHSAEILTSIEAK
jgi:hypothetical protein